MITPRNLEAAKEEAINGPVWYETSSFSTREDLGAVITRIHGALAGELECRVISLYGSDLTFEFVEPDSTQHMDEEPVDRESLEAHLHALEYLAGLKVEPEA